MKKAELETAEGRAAEAIKKCYDMRKITKRKHDTMMRHAEHYSFAHAQDAGPWKRE